MISTPTFRHLRSSCVELANRAAHAVGILRSAPPPAPRLHPFDRAHGTDTSGFLSGADLVTGHRNDPYNTAYYAMSPSRFHVVLRRWIDQAALAPVSRYSFVDLGSGKGRAVLLASTLPFQQVIGVEIHADLARIAAANVDRWRAGGHSPAPIRLLCQDATEFHFPPGPCLLYLFHPFTHPVVALLLTSIARQFQDRSDPLDLLYFNPEEGDLLEQHPGFHHLWTEDLPVSAEDARSDALANERDRCSAYRWVGTRANSESTSPG